MDTRNYCVECDMSKPCECDYVPLFTSEKLGTYYLHPKAVKKEVRRNDN